MTNGSVFSLFDAQKGRYYAGPALPCNVARLISVELPPSAIVDALLGSVLLDGTPGASRDGTRTTAAARCSRCARPMDRRRRSGSTVAAKSWDPVRAEHRDARGALVWRLVHDGFTAQGAVRLPAQTTVEDLLHHATVHLKYREQNVDPTLNDNGFQLPAPDGLPVEHVDCR